ncbi:MAG: DUF3307 domain-containing protein [Chloroflexota bacterium]
MRSILTADELLAHAIGDYLLQSHWMATAKTGAHLPAAVHAVSYTLPFLALTRSPWRLALIAGMHFVLDRWRVARYVAWAKNQLAPAPRPSWSDCQATGYPAETPPWLAVWLLILTDNLCHVLLNGLALRVGHKEATRSWL